MRKTAFLTCLILVLIALTAISASAQWGRRGNTSSLAVSIAYGSDPDGARLEYATDKLVVDGLYFRDDRRDSDILGVELGWKASGTGGAGSGSLVVGTGYYNDDPSFGGDASGIGWWAGMGDFGDGGGGMFYQFRYIFSGPLKGSQGILGWRF